MKQEIINDGKKIKKIKKKNSDNYNKIDSEELIK
jgi:hypothetical protein